MGGCASRPKDLDIGAEPAPVEAPGSPKTPEVEVETFPQDKNVEENKEQEPLIDISEPTKESPEVEEPKTTEAEIVPELTKLPEEEVKPVDSAEVTTAPVVEIAEALKEPAEVIPEVEVLTPRSVDKSDAPLVTV